MALLTRKQLAHYTGISDNLKEALFNTAVLVVQDTGLSQYISEDCIDDIEGLDNDLYLTPEDTRPELSAFYNLFVLPFFAWAVYSHIVSTHGLNWTAQGIVKFKDSINTSEAIATDERQNLVNQGLKVRGVYLSKMRKTFINVSATFDGVKYTIDATASNTQAGVQSSGMRISAPKKKFNINSNRL